MHESSIVVVHESDNILSPRAEHAAPASVKAELPEVAGRQPPIVEVAVVVFLALLIWWPLVTLAAVFVLPAMLVSAVIAVGGSAIVAPIWLVVRQVRGRHQTSQSPLPASRRRP